MQWAYSVNSAWVQGWGTDQVRNYQCLLTHGCCVAPPRGVRAWQLETQRISCR